MSEEKLSSDQTQPSADSTDPHRKSQGSKRKRRRILKIAIFLTLLLAGVVAAAPEIIARTSLRNSLINQFSPEYEGRIVLGQSSLGWLRPISIRQLSLRHPDGETWASIEDLRSEFTLLDLILEPSQLGHWSASQCEVTAECEPGMTDIERWLLDVAKEQKAEHPSNVSFSADTIMLTLNTTDQESRFQISDLDYRQTANHELGLSGKVDVLAQKVEEAEGSLDLKIDVSEKSQTTLKASAFPLDSIRPILVRLGVLQSITGTLDGSWTLVRNNHSLFAIDGQGTARGFRIGTTESPLFSIESLNLDLSAAQSVSGWTLSRLAAKSDFGQMAMEGTISLPVLWTKESTLERLFEQSFALTGDVSLSDLAEHVPGLIALQENVKLQQGTASFRFESSPEAETPRLMAQLDISDLVAKTPERTINWYSPLTANAVLLRPGKEWTLDQLNVESKAVNLTGRGKWSSAELSMDVNLAEFLEEWSRIFDFGNLKLAGQLSGQATCKATEAGPIKISGNLDCESLVLGWSQEKPWNFQKLEATFGGEGQLDEQQHFRLTAFTTTMKTDRDELTLTKGDSTAETDSWSLQGTGTLSGILGQALATRVKGRFSGQYTLKTNLSREASIDRFESIQLDIADFRYDSETLSLNESQLKLAGNVIYDHQNASMLSDELILNCPTVVARLNELKLPLDNLSLVSSKLAARGRIERLWDLMNSESSTSVPTGMLNLQLSATEIENGTNLIWKLTAEDVNWPEAKIDNPARPVSNSTAPPKKFSAEWSGKALYAVEDNVLTIAESTLTANGLDSRLSGEISKLTTTPFASVRGDIRYEWEILRKLYPDLTGPDLILHGRHQTPLKLDISLSSETSSRPMSGEFVVAWERGDWNGLPIGPARLDVNLSDDKLSMKPTEVTVSSGTVRFGPSITRSRQGALFVQPPERLLDQVQLTDEICHQWLKYVSPMTADAARVNGTFSVHNSQPLQIPLDHPERTTSEGLVMIHAAKMTPGPLAMQFITLGKQIDALRRGTPFDPGTIDPKKPLMSITRQTVPYKVEKGRVYHKDLTMQISNLNVTSAGSVGFDDSLDILATIEIPEQWTIRGKPVRAIWGPAIQIPIRGSLNRPQMDARVMKGLLDKLVRGTVTNFLEQELNKQLNNLFKPK